MSFLINFRIENLITCDKKNIYNFKDSILSKQQKVWNSKNDESFVVNLDENIQIDSNYFSNENSGSKKDFPDINYHQEDYKDQINEHKVYYPRIFSITVQNNYCLDLYIDYHEYQRRLILEVFLFR